LFDGMFFDARKYDFSRVGRMKFSIKIYDAPESPKRKKADGTRLRSAHSASAKISTTPSATC
jgi:hypothetical protein